MIEKKDFLTIVTNMPESKKRDTARRAEEWRKKYPALRAAVTSWQDAPVKDLDEGLLLCSCLRRAESFVTNAHKMNVQRCLRIINETLAEIIRIAGPAGPRTEKQKKERPVKAFIPRKPMPDETGHTPQISEQQRKRLEEEAMEEEERNDRFRPQNLKEYMHLLPVTLQAECRRVKDTYYMPLREYRSRLESLAENPNATDEQRAEMAQKLVEAENKLATFWNRVDTEYKRATGTLPTAGEPKKEFSEYTQTDIEAVTDDKLREKLKRIRIENNKRYLRRTDLPECDETRRQMRLRAAELQAWNVKITNVQRLNMEKFGAAVTEQGEDDKTLWNS